MVLASEVQALQCRSRFEEELSPGSLHCSGGADAQLALPDTFPRRHQRKNASVSRADTNSLSVSLPLPLSLSPSLSLSLSLSPSLSLPLSPALSFFFSLSLSLSHPPLFLALSFSSSGDLVNLYANLFWRSVGRNQSIEKKLQREIANLIFNPIFK